MPDPVRAEAEPAAVPKITATTRAQAMALLDQVAGFLRGAEPSSPIPLLVERARALADRDFITVLRAVLPSSSLFDITTES
jgi:type VI secretion system protein ImpA